MRFRVPRRGARRELRGFTCIDIGGQPCGRAPWVLQLAFNGGRNMVYRVVGAVAGMAGSTAMFLNQVLPVQLEMFVPANRVVAMIAAAR